MPQFDLKNSNFTPISDDGLIGIDSFGQFNVRRVDGEWTYTTIMADPRGRTCPICGRGWEFNGPAVSDQFWPQDRGELVHLSCFERKVAWEEKELFLKALGASGWEVPKDARYYKHVEEIPNEYGAAWNTPWYKATLPNMHGYLKFGRRKSVYEIAFHLDDGYEFEEKQRKAIERLFHGEDVTKSFSSNSFYLHAHGDEKAKEYIVKISFALTGHYDSSLIYLGSGNSEWFDAIVKDTRLRKMKKSALLIRDIKRVVKNKAPEILDQFCEAIDSDVTYSTKMKIKES